MQLAVGRILDRLFALNRLRWPVRFPVKWAIFGLVWLVVCFPFPSLLIRHIQHWSDPSALVDPNAAALQPLIAELRPKITDDLTPKQVLATVEKYVLEKIEYDWDWNTWGMVDYLPTVAEAIDAGREDCDGRAVVAASLLSHLGFEAELVTDFAHVWVKTEAGETMGPGKRKAVIASKKGLNVTASALGELPRALALGIGVFPWRRELIILIVAWLLMLRRHGGIASAATALTMLIAGLYLLRVGGREYLKPNVWLLCAGVWIMAGGLLCTILWAGRNARRATDKPPERPGFAGIGPCK